MDKGTLVLVIAGILLLVVAIQAFQLSGLVKTAKAASVPASTAVPSAPAQTQGASSAGSGTGAAQVGGC